MRDEKANGFNVRLVIVFLMIAYGLGRFFVAAFAHPPIESLQEAILIQLGISVFYVLCGIWIYIAHPGFSALCVLFFITFILEMSQIGIY